MPRGSARDATIDEPALETSASSARARFASASAATHAPPLAVALPPSSAALTCAASSRRSRSERSALFDSYSPLFRDKILMCHVITANLEVRAQRLAVRARARLAHELRAHVVELAPRVRHLASERAGGEDAGWRNGGRTLETKQKSGTTKQQREQIHRQDKVGDE